jgi:hypothetical protein
MKKIFLALIALSIISSFSYAQDCGPNCPLCSGSGLNTEGMLIPGTIFANVLFVPDGEETVVSTLKFATHKRLNIGIGYINKSEAFIWNARLLLLQEKEKFPGFVVGTGSVRMGGSDQSVFFSATKNFEENLGIPLRISVGAASIVPDFNEIYFIGTVSYLIKEVLFPFVSYDGINPHYGATLQLFKNFTIGAYYIEKEYLGFSAGLRFNIRDVF